MNIYKFRPLGNDTDFNHAKDILETGCFWCSRFLELNDPMEGVYSTKINDSEIEDIFGEKCKYKICSFSGKGAFENPSMWGYYANGFKGLAIEIEVQEWDVEEIKYSDDIRSIINPSNADKIKEILTTKISPWKQEEEFRFLTPSDENRHKIGKITGVYFGDPYEKFKNRMMIIQNSTILSNYKTSVDKLKKATHNNGIKWCPVEINDRLRVMKRGCGN